MLPLFVIILLSVTLFPQSIADANPQSHRRDYMVVEYGNHVLSKVTSAGDRTVIYRFQEGTWPRSIAVDDAGNFVVTELLADILSRIDPSGRRALIHRFPRGTIPDGVAIDSAGNYIVTESGVNILSRITPAGARTVAHNFSGWTCRESGYRFEG